MSVDVRAIVEDAIRDLSFSHRTELQVALPEAQFRAVQGARLSEWFMERSAQLERSGKLIRFIKSAGR